MTDLNTTETPVAATTAVDTLGQVHEVVPVDLAKDTAPVAEAEPVTPAAPQETFFAQQEGQHIAHTFLDAIEHLVKLVREHL